MPPSPLRTSSPTAPDMTRPIGRVVHLNNQHLLMDNNPLVAWANGERRSPPLQHTALEPNR